MAGPVLIVVVLLLLPVLMCMGGAVLAAILGWSLKTNVDDGTRAPSCSSSTGSACGPRPAAGQGAVRLGHRPSRAVKGHRRQAGVAGRWRRTCPSLFQQRSVERQMLDAIGEAVVATDADGQRHLHATRPPPSAFHGGTADDLLGQVRPRPPRRRRPAARSCRRSREAILDGRSPGPASSPAGASDGSTFPHRVTLAPCYDEDGTIVGTVGVGRDITPEVVGARPGPGPATSASVGSSTRARSPWASSASTCASSGPTRPWSACSATRRRSWPAGPWSRSPTPTTSRRTSRAAAPLLEGRRSRPIRSRSGSSARTARSSSAGSPGTVVRDDDGEPMYGIGTVEDLTATLGAFSEHAGAEGAPGPDPRGRRAWPRGTST